VPRKEIKDEDEQNQGEEAAHVVEAPGGAKRARGWPSHDIAITNSVWCMP